MAYYLVDYENVKADGMYGVDQLGKKDCVCIFYSENASTLTFGLHEKSFPQSAHTKKTNLLKMYDSSFSFFILAVDCFHPSELSGCSSVASSGRACVCGASAG